MCYGNSADLCPTLDDALLVPVVLNYEQMALGYHVLHPLFLSLMLLYFGEKPLWDIEWKYHRFYWALMLYRNFGLIRDEHTPRGGQASVY